MLVIIGHFRIPVANLGAAKAPIARVVAQTRSEDGCIKYAYAEDPADQGLFHVSEVWTDQAALDAHFAADHMKQWQVEREKLGMSERSITAYTVSSSKTL